MSLKPLGLVLLFSSVALGCGTVHEDPSIDAAAGEVDAPTAPDAMPLTWSAHTLVSVGYVGAVRTPVVTGDGLTMYFMGDGPGSGDIFDIYSAGRASTSEGFGTATAVPVINVSGKQGRYVEVSSDGLEIYFQHSDTTALMVATRVNLASAFSTPVAVDSGLNGYFPSISGDKLSLYFIAPTTGADGELKRITRAAVGAGWSTPTTIALTGAVEIFSSIDVSSDELAILRAPALASGDAMGNLIINRRASKTDPFEEVEVLANVDMSTSPFASARWSANDTEIWTGQNDGSIERPFVSRLE